MTERNRFFARVNTAIRDNKFTEAVSLVNEDGAGLLEAGEAEWFFSRVLFAENKLEEAERVTVEGLQKSPAHYGLYRVLGEIMGEAGEVESARKCLQGSSLDSYINNKYFTSEQSNLVIADSDQESQQATVVYQESEKNLPSIHQLPAAGFRHEFSNNTLFPSTPSVFVLEHGKVWFDGHNLCVYDQDDVLINSCTMGNPLLIESIRHEVTPTHLSGNLGVVVARSANNYFHWTTDVAPGFHLLDQMSGQHGEIDAYLVSHSEKAFQTDFMQMAAVDRGNVFSQGQERGQYFIADKLLVPVFRHRMGMGMGRWAVDYLRNIAAQQENTQTGTPKRRIYVSRRDVKSRGVENENELIEFLQGFGFEDVTLDGKSLAQQMKLFRESEFIFAPHGAGLTNILYCENGTRVIEFFADFVQPCFRSLAYLCDVEYGHFSTIESVANESDLEASKRKHVIQHQNYSVNLENVSSILEQLGVTTEHRMTG